MSLLTYSLLLDCIIFVSSISIALYTYFTWDFNYWQKRNVPFVTPTAIFGNFLDLATGRATFYEVLNQFYNRLDDADFYGIWIFRKPCLVLRNPEIIRHVLVKDFHHFSDRSVTCDNSVDPIAGHILFIAKNPLWRNLRPKLTPVLTNSKLKKMVPLINDTGHQFSEYLKTHASQGPIECRELCAKFTTDVLTSCAFGLNANSFKYEDADFRNVGRQISNFSFINGLRLMSYFFTPKVVKMFKFAMFDRSLTDFLSDAFWHAVDERKKSGTQRNDLIGAVLAMMKTKEIGNDVALSQAILFFLAGFETTATTFSSLLYELAVHKNYQTQLREELKEVTAANVDYETLKSFKFLDQTIKETLRKYPIFPFLDRQCVRDYKIPNHELTIEKGTNIYIPTMALHYDEKYFPDAMLFDPNRFSEKNIENVVPYTYLPFGAGPRNCLGEMFGFITIKLGIIHAITNFNIDICDKTLKKFTFSSKSILLQPVEGMYLNFTPITK